MDKEKAERIIKIVDWVRYIITAVFLTFDRWKLDIHSMYRIHKLYNFNVYNPSLIKGTLNLLSAFKYLELETKNYTSFSEAELRNSFCFLQTKEREMLKIKNLAK